MRINLVRLTVAVVSLALLGPHVHAERRTIARVEVSKEAGLGRFEAHERYGAVLSRDEGIVSLLLLDDPNPGVVGTYDDGITDSFDGDLVFSKDGRWLLYARQTHRFSKDGIHVLDVSDPAEPTLAFYQPQGGTLRIAMFHESATEWVFTLDAIHGLVTNILNTTTGALVPVNAEPLPALKVGGPASAGLWVEPARKPSDRPLLYVTTGRTGLQVYDITEPNLPVLLGEWNDVGLAEIVLDVTGKKRTIYGATEYWFNKQIPPEVVVLDVTDPGSIRERGRFSIDAAPDDLWRVQGMELVRGDLVVAHSKGGVVTFNRRGRVIQRLHLAGARNEGSPYLDAPIAFDVDAADGRLYVTDAATGILTVLKI